MITLTSANNSAVDLNQKVSDTATNQETPRLAQVQAASVDQPSVAHHEPMTAPTEIERKWHIETLPDLSGLKAKAITQGYLAIGKDGTEVRLRQKADQYFQTVKSEGGLVRQEFETTLNQEQFDTLWPATDGKRLEKDRYKIPHDNHTIELDVYKGKLKGLVVAEVEFKSMDEAKSFSTPAWFGKDVTDNKGFKNKNLAMLDAAPQAPSQEPKVNAPKHRSLVSFFKKYL